MLVVIIPTPTLEASTLHSQHPTLGALTKRVQDLGNAGFGLLVSSVSGSRCRVQSLP